MIVFANLLLGLATLVPWSAPATLPAGYWSGRFAAEGRVWEMALDVPPGGGPEAIRIDMPSLWRMGEPVPALSVSGDSVSFDLLWDMGRVEGRRVGDRIEGVVRLAGGPVVPLRLRREARPRTRRVEIPYASGEARIGATLVLPEGAGPFPVVVVLHGGGDSSREESPPYRFWGEYLARRGYAVLLYDKRGNGESTGNWREVGFDARAADVLEGVRRVRDRPEVDPGRVGLLAVSQGSWVAGIVAAGDPRLAFVVHVSGPAVSVREADTHALRAELERDRLDERSIGERLAVWDLLVEFALSEDDDEAWRRLERAVREAAERSWSETHPVSTGERDSWWKGWYGRVADHDPVPFLRRSSTPMLWVYGVEDGESDIVRNVEVLERLRTSDDKAYTIATFPGAGHGLMVPVTDDGIDRPPLTAAPGFLGTVLGWMDARVREEGGTP